eukprot:scaffold115488_cov15-Tisochrysis_lutea.AAC.1
MLQPLPCRAVDPVFLAAPSFPCNPAQAAASPSTTASSLSSDAVHVVTPQPKTLPYVLLLSCQPTPPHHCWAPPHLYPRQHIHPSVLRCCTLGHPTARNLQE